MSKPITLTIFHDPAQWLRDNVPDMCLDSVAAVRRSGPFNPMARTLYFDREQQLTKSFTIDDHIEALRKLTEQIGRTLFVGGLRSPFDLLDYGNWDVEVVDAFYQLIYHGEVIYG